MDEKKDKTEEKTSILKTKGLFVIVGAIMFIGLAIKLLPDHAAPAAISSIAIAQPAHPSQNFAYNLGFVIGASPETSCEAASLLVEKTTANINQCRNGALTTLNTPNTTPPPDNKILSPYEMGQAIGENIKTSCQQAFKELSQKITLSIPEDSFTNTCAEGASKGFNANSVKPIQQLNDIHEFLKNTPMPEAEINTIMSSLTGSP